MADLTRLTRTELQAIEAETAMLTGAPPTLESLQVEGYRETVWLNAALDWIGSAGRVVTLFIAEFIQAGAALAIAVVFALLEYCAFTMRRWRLGSRKHRRRLSPSQW